MPRRIFISYGHDEHSSFALRLKQDLESRGHKVWFDLDRLKAGVDWQQDIEEGLEWVSAIPGEGRFLLLMTPHTVRRPDGYCLNELDRALRRKLKVVPVMIVRCEPPLPICRLQYLDVEDCLPLPQRENRYQLKLLQLLDALEHDRLDFEGVHGRLLQRLQPLSFDAELQEHTARFTGRKWVLDRVADWLADSAASRVFWITGEPGVGKTALACWLCLHCPQVDAFHLCRHGHSGKSDPRRAILSLTFQLSSQLRDYQERLNLLNLEELIVNDNAESLFDNLVVQPLSGSFKKPERAVVVLIDALDEVTTQGENVLAALIGSQFEKAPDWLRLILTSRPEPLLENLLQTLNPYLLNASAPENIEDLRVYLTRELQPFADQKPVPENWVDEVLARSEGLFLYAEWVCKELQRGQLSLRRLHEFPQGLGGIYTRFFRRQFPDKNAFKDRFLPVLEAIAATQTELEIDYLSRLFSWSEYDRQEVFGALGSLFPISGGRIRPFHLSVLEWLVDSRRAGNYFVSVVAGHRRLANYGWEHISDAPDGYTLRYLASHLEGAQRVDDLHRLLRLERPVGERRENAWYAIKARAGQLDGYLEDVDRAWRQAQSAHDVSLQVRYALCSTSVRCIANIPPPLLELALRYDVLTWRQALALARLPREPAQRAQGLSRLLQLFPEEERKRIATDVFDIARINKLTDILPKLIRHLPRPLLNGVLEVTKNVEWEDTQADLLAALIPCLADQELDAVSEVADAIQAPLPRVCALASLVCRRSGKQRARLLAKVNAIVGAMPDSADKVRALSEIAKCQHDTLRATTLDRALSIALKLDYSRDLAPALGALATKDLSPSQLADALEFAAETYRVEDCGGTKESYVSVLFAFGPLMSPDQRTDIIGKFVSRLRLVKSPIFRESASLLAGILSLYAPQEQQIGLFRELFPYLIRGSSGRGYSLIRERRRTVVPQDWKRAAALQVLSNLPPSLAEIGLESVDKIFNDDDRADILHAIVPSLPQARRAQVLSAEVARASVIGDTLARTQALTSLAKHMPKGQRAGLAETLLHAAETMGHYRFEAIATLAPCLENTRSGEVIGKALLAIREFSDSRSRRSALMALAPVLQSAVSDALQIAEGLDVTDYPALASLVPYVAIHQRHDVIDKALKAAQGWVAVELPEDFIAVLKTLAGYMDQAQLVDVWEIGRNLRDPQHADVVALLAPSLNRQQLEEAVAILHNIPHNAWTADHRARAWAALAPRLSGRRKTAALSEALEAVNDPGIAVAFVLTLPVLMPQLKEEERLDVLSKALHRAQSIDEDNVRAATLCNLAPSFSGPDRLTAIEQILESCTGTRVVMTISSTRIRRGIDREFLLRQIANLADTLAEMSGETLVAEIVSAISDTTAWWA